MSNAGYAETEAVGAEKSWKTPTPIRREDFEKSVQILRVFDISAKIRLNSEGFFGSTVKVPR